MFHGDGCDVYLGQTKTYTNIGGRALPIPRGLMESPLA